MITTRDGLIAALAGAQRFDLFKTSTTSEGAGTWHSLWALTGYPPAGSTPPAKTAGSGYIPTKSTTGAIPWTGPAGGSKTYLGQLVASFATAGALIIYDRLWACSGFDTTLTTAQTVTTPGTVDRPDTTGEGVEIWGEVYTAPGATTATWTASYTNTAGTAGRSATYTHPANAESIGQLFRFTLQAGDTGVQSVQSLTCSVSSGTAGNIGITLVRRIAMLPGPIVNVAQLADFFTLGGGEIPDNACLALAVQCSTTNTGNVLGQVSVIQG